jgi:hypothetical protein
MANITKVPNGPLIKKKGPFKGSTLKSGGTVKKAQGGVAMTKRDSTMADIKEQSRLRQNLTDFRKKVGDKPLTSAQIREKDSLKGLLSDYSTKKRVKATGVSAEQLAKNDQKLKEKMARKPDAESDGSNASGCYKRGKTTGSCVSGASYRGQSLRDNRRNGGPVKKAKAGAMIKRAQNGDTLTVKKTKIDGFYKNLGKQPSKNSDSKNFYKGEKSKIKDDGFFKGPKVRSTGLKNGGLIKRADGSMSKRGLWDNIRANKGSGKKPTAAMLKQEKKIKAKTKK